MRRIIIVLITLITLLAFDDATAADGGITRQGNTFVEAPSEKSRKSEVIQTPYTWTTKDGKSYTVMMTKSSGSCFIIKVSKKTGKEYRQYLPKEVCAQICKEMGIEYKPKK